MPPHTYKPLPDPGNYIRVLTIEPGAFNDDIITTLRVKRFDRNTPPRYYALSYVWGSTEDPKSIEIALPARAKSELRGTISVTQNLDCALRHLRTRNERRPLWIDALCIDQRNNAEKGPQVAMMGDIYRLATVVVAWLGPKSGSSSHAMWLIGNVGELGEDIEPTTRQWIPKSASVSEIFLGGKRRLPFTASDLRSLLDFLKRPYFQRLWIRQEVYLPDPKNVIVACGEQQLMWPIFRIGYFGVCILAFICEDSSLAAEFQSVRRAHVGFGTPRPYASLYALREEFGDVACQDGRDRIYAILSLLHGRERQGVGIQPDYTRTIAEVFCDVVVRSISWSKHVWILEDCQISHGFSPSWGPDWSQKSSTLMAISPPMTASSLILAVSQFPDERILRLAGVSVAKITRLHHTPLIFDNLALANSETSTQPQIHEVQALKFLRERLLQKGLHAEYASGGSMLNAYATTLVCGLFGDLYEPPMLGAMAGAAECRDFCEQIASSSPDILPDWKLLEKHAKVAHQISRIAHGRRLFEASGGLIGMGPSLAQEGDEVRVFLGSKNPMVLRRVPGGHNTFNVVGSCYMHGASMGEPLLGPLPEGFQALEVSAKPPFVGFRDTRSGSVSPVDPRLFSLPIDLNDFLEALEEGKKATISVDPRVLRQWGIDVRDFDLV